MTNSSKPFWLKVKNKGLSPGFSKLGDSPQVLKIVSDYLITLYDDKELSAETTIRKFRIVQTEGNRQVSRLVDHYRIEAILSVGYRVRSQRGVRLRRWATNQL